MRQDKPSKQTPAPIVKDNGGKYLHITGTYTRPQYNALYQLSKEEDIPLTILLRMAIEGTLYSTFPPFRDMLAREKDKLMKAQPMEVK